MASPVVQRQQWHGCTRAEHGGEGGGRENIGRGDMDVVGGGAGDGVVPLVAPLHLLPLLRLAQSTLLLHPMV